MFCRPQEGGARCLSPETLGIMLLRSNDPATGEEPEALRDRRIMRFPSCLSLMILSLVLLAPTPSFGQSAEEEEARERLAEAKEAVSAEDYQKGLEAADAALRRYPSLYEAMMYKALAYEGLGELKRAKGLLSTFKQVSFSEEDKATADEALVRIQDKLGEARKATVDQEAAALSQSADDSEAEDESGDEEASPAQKEEARMAVPLDMPDFPEGSEEFLSWMLYRQQLSLLEVRRDTGIAILAGGGGLTALGAGVAGAMVGASSQTANDPNIEAGYAAGLGALFSGVALVGIGLPLTIIHAAKASKLSRSRTSTALRGPHVDIKGGALALRF